MRIIGCIRLRARLMLVIPDSWSNFIVYMLRTRRSIYSAWPQIIHTIFPDRSQLVFKVFIPIKCWTEWRGRGRRDDAHTFIQSVQVSLRFRLPGEVCASFALLASVATSLPSLFHLLVQEKMRLAKMVRGIVPPVSPSAEEVDLELMAGHDSDGTIPPLSQHARSP